MVSGRKKSRDAKCGVNGMFLVVENVGIQGFIRNEARNFLAFSWSVWGWFGSGIGDGLVRFLDRQMHKLEWNYSHLL